MAAPLFFNNEGGFGKSPSPFSDSNYFNYSLPILKKTTKDENREDEEEKDDEDENDKKET